MMRTVLPPPSKHYGGPPKSYVGGWNVLAVGLLAAAVGCAALTGAGGSGLPEGKLVVDKEAGPFAVSAAAGPIKADGQLTEPAWKNATAFSGFTSGTSGAKPEVETRVLVTYDKDNLYIAVINDEPNTDKLVAKATTRDGNVWSDDSDEIYLDPKLEKGREFYGLFVNCKNVIYDRMRDDKWSGEWTSGVSVIAGKAWVVEVAIPFKTLDITPSPGHKLGLMIARNHVAGKTRSKQHYLAPCGGEAKDTSSYLTLELK